MTHTQGEGLTFAIGIGFVVIGVVGELNGVVKTYFQSLTTDPSP